MSLKELFESNIFTENKTIKLSDNDIEYFIEKLNKGNELNQVRPFISVVETLPLILLKPIVEKVLKYKDVSSPKKYMEDVSRVFTPAIVQKAFFNKMVNSTDYKVKCKVAGILYCIRGSYVIEKISKRFEPIAKFSAGYVWNGENYKFQIIDAELEPYLKQQIDFRFDRLKTLVKEFTKHQNVIYRYYLSLNLSHEIEDYPNSIKEEANRIIQIVTKDDFPKSATSIIKRVKGNSELEDLLFNRLNWQRKEASS